MHRLNITAKIWLSVGVFILGYVLSTGLSQIQGSQARSSLRTTSAVLFPAAQRSQEAEAAFQRQGQGLSDAVITQDSGGLDRAAEDGRQTVAALKAVAAIPGLSAERSADAGKLASGVDQILADARTTYGAVMGGAMTPIGHAQAAFQEVSTTIASGTQLVSQIAASSGEQALGITSIGEAITRIESLTQRNVITAQNTAEGASAMASQVENTRKYLDELVAVVGLHSA